MTLRNQPPFLRRIASRLMNPTFLYAIKKKRNSRQRSALRPPTFEPLEQRELFAVTYHGGDLLANVQTQAVYLGSDWTVDSNLASQRQQIDHFLQYIVQSPYMDSLTSAGYNVGRGSAAPGKAIDLSYQSPAILTDSQIRSQLQTAISRGTLQQPNSNTLYTVYVPPKVSIQSGKDSSETNFLGYHGAFSGRDANNKTVDIRYAVIAYPGTPNPTAVSQGFSNAFDQLTSVTSHELAEAVTDPDANYRRVGWYDDSQVGEIGDLTRQTTKLGTYTVQAFVDKNDRVVLPSATNATPTPKISSPTNISATVLSSTSIRLSWSSVSSATGYRVYEVLSSGKVISLGSVASGITAVDISQLSPGSKVSFYVQAFDGASTANSDLREVSLPATQILTSPSLSATLVSNNVSQLTWTSVEGAEGYRIFQVIGNRLILAGTVDAQTLGVTVSLGQIRNNTSWIVQAFAGQNFANSAIVSISSNKSMSWLDQWLQLFFRN